jgi:hypothetical protein
MTDPNKVKGGYARAANMSPERRSEIARAAAKARWALSPEDREAVGKQHAEIRWREQGRSENEITQGLTNWGKPRKEYRKVTEDFANPYMGRSYDELRSLRADVRREISSLKLRTSRLNSTLENLNQAIIATDPAKFVVSEHAILRYLERMKGIDVSAIREEIRNKVEQVSFGDNGSRIVDVGDCKFVVAQTTIQTMINDDESPSGYGKGPVVERTMVVTTLSPHMDTTEEEEARAALVGKLGEPS